MRICLFFAAILIVTACSQPTDVQEHSYSGYAQGSTYTIKLIGPRTEGLEHPIDSILKAVDASMSTYQKTSLISAINVGDTFYEVDPIFKRVLNRSLEIATETQGKFDPTVGPLVDLWGFGKERTVTVDSSMVDSAMNLVGYPLIQIEGDRVKIPKGSRIDFNAIAQGFTVDLIAEYVENLGCHRYMIEVGGELRVKGLNTKGHPWKIGVDKPAEQMDEKDRFQIILDLKDIALATSGNYRKFWVDENTGVKYAHTINPITGYTARNTLLSVTILANTAMDADAYATACMVMGLEQSVTFIDSKPDLEAYFIYSNEQGEWRVIQTEGFASYVAQAKS